MLSLNFIAVTGELTTKIPGYRLWNAFQSETLEVKQSPGPLQDGNLRRMWLIKQQKDRDTNSTITGFTSRNPQETQEKKKISAIVGTSSSFIYLDTVSFYFQHCLLSMTAFIWGRQVWRVMKNLKYQTSLMFGFYLEQQ